MSNPDIKTQLIRIDKSPFIHTDHKKKQRNSTINQAETLHNQNETAMHLWSTLRIPATFAKAVSSFHRLIIVRQADEIGS